MLSHKRPPNQQEQFLAIDLKSFLKGLGIDLENDNFRETPERVAHFWHEFTQREEPFIKVFPSDSTDEVALDGYKTWGMCPHHLLPVQYTVNISYEPCGKVFGISKLPRIVDYLLRTLPLQEDLPKLIVDYIHEKLHVETAHCSVTGKHLCMIMRGVKADGCSLTTSHTLNRRDLCSTISQKSSTL